MSGRLSTHRPLVCSGFFLGRLDIGADQGVNLQRIAKEIKMELGNDDKLFYKR